MLRQGFTRASFLILIMGLAPLAAAATWYLELPEEVTVNSTAVRVADLAVKPVPAAQGKVIILGKGDPGSSVSVNRSLVLRKLVQAGLAGGVIFKGSAQTNVNFQGEEVSCEVLRQKIRALVQGLVPAPQPGAPASWFDLDLPDRDLTLSEQSDLELDRSNNLASGRNNIRVKFKSPGENQYLPVVVHLHNYGEIPSARLNIKRGVPLTEDHFQWQWLDLAEIQNQLVTDRNQLQGSCVARSLTAGDQLRLSDLKPIPMIEPGDMVDLTIQRGGLVVTVRALARQAGCQGQTIPVRNELNGRLVNARVMGPGRVAWRN